MTPSQRCLDLIKSFENCKLTAYLDQAGIPTIGYGSTGPGIELGVTWSQSQANMALVARCNAIGSILNGCVRPTLTQNEFDALVSLCYNIGQGAFRGSKLLKAINTRDEEGIKQEWLSWDHIKGVVVQGLLNRREAELELFLTPVEGFTG